MTALIAYPWPGNIRQLMSEIERACTNSTSDIVEFKNLSEEIRDYCEQFIESTQETEPNNHSETEYKFKSKWARENPELTATAIGKGTAKKATDYLNEACPLKNWHATDVYKLEAWKKRKATSY